MFYVLFQFLGGVFGVAVAATIFGSRLSKPAVDYVVTVPGALGVRYASDLVLQLANFIGTQEVT
jgi:aquaporin Z